MNLASRSRKTLTIAAFGVAALCISTWEADAAPYVQTDLVSDISGLATITDADLVNPWGISHSSTSPFWISNQGTSTSTLYAVTGKTNVTKTNINPPAGDVKIPKTASGPQGPTGQVNNGNTSSFLLTNGDQGSARFIFANLNGTISGWDGGTTAIIQATTTGAVYTGLAINQAQTRLYAANDAGTTGSIDVFDSSFKPVTTLPAGAFATPTAVAALGLVPFNVQDINGKVYVTYAPSGRANQTAATEGQGAVVIFNEDGTSLQTLILGSDLAAPWGIALASAAFGEFANDLLVGNFSFINSEINAFNPTTGVFIGTIPIDDGGKGAGGLWALNFGIGGQNGDPNILYFNDGIAGETHGLFAALTPVPEPSGLAILGTALALLAIRRTRARR